MRDLTELVVRSLPLLVIGSYAVGYLIVLIYDSQQGFLESSLLKPRAVVAGVVFLFSIGLPLSLTSNTFLKSSSGVESAFESIPRILRGTTDYVVGCVLAAIMMTQTFQDAWKPVVYSPLKISICLLAITYTVAANGISRLTPHDSYKTYPVFWIIFYSLCLTSIVVGICLAKDLILFRCFIWVAVVTTLVNPIASDVKRGIKISFRPLVIVGVFLSMLSAYAAFIFPHMKAAWGGGTPIEINIFLSSDSSIHPNQKTRAELLESSEAGFYLRFPEERKISYIPRSSVKYIEYAPLP